MPRLHPMTPVDEILSGRYRVERLLGQGGMSDVFRAVDVTTGEGVAVKLMRSADPELARRLAQEGKALARLDHVGLVRLLDAGVHHDQAFLVMELVEGPTLAARLRRGPLSPARTAMLGSTLAGALAYVHSQGIVHRDVKPANVLLGPGPRVRLADFGIARLADASSLTVTGTTLGTAGYMAPEQLEHHTVGTSADVWSLGVILLECLTGRRVFEGTATEIVARRLSRPAPLPHDLPAPWRLLFEGMLAPDPAQRPSAAHVAGLLPATPFAEPWHREEAPTEALTEPVAPGAGTTGNGRQALADGAGHDPGPGTLVAPAAVAASPATGEPSPSRHRSRSLWVIMAAVVLVAAGLSAWALASHGSPSSKGHPPASTTTSAPTTSTTSAPSTTTTTPAPTASSAAAALASDVAAGVATGDISSDASKSILDELNQAQSASANGSPDQVSAAIGSMDGTIAHEVQSGSMTPAEASKLVADVSTLATALGVTATPSSSSTTTPRTSRTTDTTAGGGHGGGNT